MQRSETWRVHSHETDLTFSEVTESFGVRCGPARSTDSDWLFDVGRSCRKPLIELVGPSSPKEDDIARFDWRRLSLMVAKNVGADPGTFAVGVTANQPSIDDPGATDEVFKWHSINRFNRSASLFVYCNVTRSVGVRSEVLLHGQ
jgi:hypothetical protein